MDGHTIYVQRRAKNNDFSIDIAIFTKALPADGPTDGPTNQWTNRLTEGRTHPLIESWLTTKRKLIKRGRRKKEKAVGNTDHQPSQVVMTNILCNK